MKVYIKTISKIVTLAATVASGLVAGNATFLNAANASASIQFDGVEL
jgi:hypothetical protein